MLVTEQPETAKWSTKEKTDQLIHVCVLDNPESCAKIHFAPFKMEFIRSGKLLVTANAKGKMAFEETKATQEVGTESFKGHTDTMPSGHQAIRLDFTFHDAKNIYGLPQHTDGLALKDTADGDPYRYVRMS